MFLGRTIEDKVYVRPFPGTDIAEKVHVIVPGRTIADKVWVRLTPRKNHRT